MRIRPPLPRPPRDGVLPGSPVRFPLIGHANGSSRPVSPVNYSMLTTRKPPAASTVCLSTWSDTWDFRVTTALPSTWLATPSPPREVPPASSSALPRSRRNGFHPPSSFFSWYYILPSSLLFLIVFLWAFHKRMIRYRSPRSPRPQRPSPKARLPHPPSGLPRRSHPCGSQPLPLPRG